MRLTGAIVRLRWPLLVLWIAGAALAWTQLPTLGDSSSSPIDDIAPSHSPAMDAQKRALQLFGVPAGSDLVVVQRRASGLTADDVERHAALAARAISASRADPSIPLRGALPIVDVDAGGTRWNEQRTTALDVLFVSGSANLDERTALAKEYARKLALAPGSRVGVTGAAPARLAQYGEIEDVLPYVTLATLGVILLVAALYFRSLAAPVVTLGTAGIAYVVAVRVLAWGSEKVGVSVPREIEPLLVVLLLGLVTDYTVFFLADARQRMLRGEDRLTAARSSTARIWPTVLTAGTIVAACSASLLAGKLEFFRAFGPGMAICALIVTVVALTLVPAIVAIAGPRLFGRKVREASGDPTLAFAPPPTPPIAARALASRPVAAVLTLACVAGLGLAASRVLDVHLGVAFASGLPHDSGPRVAGDDAAAGFAGGIAGPTDVVLEGAGVARDAAGLSQLRRAVDARPGVAAVLGPGAQEVLQRVLPGTPSVLATKDGNAARLVVVFDREATSAATLDHVRKLRDALPGLIRDAGLPAGTRVELGGEGPLAAETVDAVQADTKRIAVAIALVTLVLLVLFLRALVAPVLLLAAGLLGYLASLGLTGLAAHFVYGDHQLTYYVPLVGAVLLVALGSDYNVLIAGRIRSEAETRTTSEAIAIAVPQASRAITVAGLTLASTFALLALVPLRSFRELAMLLAIGVLVDALVVRTMLIPSLLSLFGRSAWWPRRTTPRRPDRRPPQSSGTPDGAPVLSA